MNKPQWYSATAGYGVSSWRHAAWQLLNTLVPYAALWALMITLVREGYPLWTLAVAAPLAGALLVRIFIFFHDCCHGSFLPSKTANRVLGVFLGLLVFTPFQDWKRAHQVHHSSAGDLERRGTGDIWTLTVSEYRELPGLMRLAYRLFRNPLIMFSVGPSLLFLVIHRFTTRGGGTPERHSVLFTNLTLLCIIAAAGFIMGFKTYLLIQLPVIVVAGFIGLWLFYHQHQFEGVYWARHDDKDLIKVALEGSSYYKLPKVLQWFTGNIGLHHVHHLRPNIPNYNLQSCHDDIAALRQVAPLTLRQSLDSSWLSLWDERQQKLVSFAALKTLPKPS